MKILYDHQIFTSQVFGGISRYFFELINHFQADDEIGFELALRYSNNSYLKNADWIKVNPFFQGKSFFGKTTLHNMLNNIFSVRSIKGGKYDIFHPTYYNPYYLPLVGRRPTVVTVYDLTHELYPEQFAPDDRTISWKKEVLANAARIIAISEHTKADLLRNYPVDERRVSVVHLAASLQDSANLSSAENIPQRYLLYVGQRNGYKNFDFFVRAVAPVLLEDPELSVVCAGGGPFNSRESQMLADLGVGDRFRQCSASDETLGTLYRKALAFVFPSLYEGFGIPVLEAFSCNCPVLASNRSSLPEVAGDGALLFDPEDEYSLCSLIRQLAGDADLRGSLVARGKKRAGEFSWSKVAGETKAVYESI